MAKTIFVLLGLSLTLYFASAHPGVRDPETAPLIVGGEPASPGEFPWMVDVRRTAHSCGASIVNENWVVTAAHCAQYAVSDYTLVAGDHNNLIEEGTEQRRKVVLIVNHPDYVGGVYHNDVSLMKVDKPFELNSRVQPVSLPPAGFDPTALTTAVGWGRTTEGGTSSSDLLKVTVPYIDDTKCRRAYSESRILDSMICAGLLGEGGKDACQGDSGGPLMCGKELCGIVSWGTGCARPNYPGVYTEVSYFTSWIHNTIRSNS